MYYSFAAYEQDFRAWWASKQFPEVGPLTCDFLTHVTRPDAPRRLWRHQEEALMRVVYARELLQWDEHLLNIVTGGGKTAIIGAVIAWLKVCHDINKFVLLCPNTIVRDRLEDDFKEAKVFRDFGFFPPGTEHYTNELGLHVMQPGGSPQGIRDNGIILGIVTSSGGGGSIKLISWSTASVFLSGMTESSVLLQIYQGVIRTEKKPF